MTLGPFLNRKFIGTPFDQLIAYLEEHGVTAQAEPESKLIRFAHDGKDAVYECAVLVGDDPPFFQFFTVIPMAVPSEKLQDIAEFAARANWGSTIGRFEVGFDSGELRYQTSVPIADGQIQEEFLEPLIAANIMTVEAYFPAIVAVLSGVSPAVAVREAESSHHKKECSR
jgi:hypothetical protein